MSPVPVSRDAEVVIAGGGMVGATLALLLAGRSRIEPRRIVIVEPSPPVAPMPGDPPGLRVSAISPGHRAQFAALGVWERLDPARIGHYERMTVWHHSVPPDSPDVLHFDAAEAGERDLGSIVENSMLQAALLAQCAATGIVMRRGALHALRIDDEAAHLELTDGSLSAELVVGADGAASAVRGMLAMPARQRDYGQRAIVATVRTGRPHGNTAWQRFLDSGPLALLPLPGQQCSIVWSAVRERADALLALAVPEFEAALNEASAGVLGVLQLASERAAFPLQQLSAQEYVRPRVALVGDAAHVIHPLAGQGVNQGLEDAACLSAALSARPPRESAGALAALLRYERERRAGNALVGGLVDGFNSLFTGAGPVRTAVATTGLRLAARSRLARQFFVRQAVAGRSSPRR